MLWNRLKKLWSRYDEKQAERELHRAAAESDAPQVPHPGPALFDEPFERTETVPPEDLPG